MTQSFTADFFPGNRLDLVEAVPNSYILIAAHSMLQESADLAFPFRQDSSFWYFCGLDEPDAVIAINTADDSTTLFLPEQNDYQKEWDGELNTEAYEAQSGITDYKSLSDLEYSLKSAQKKDLQICYLAPLDERVEPYGFYSNPARRNLQKAIERVIPDARDVRLEVARLRQVKQPAEIAAIQSAIDVTATALERVKRNITNYKTEKELERAITAEMYACGSDGHAYEPIVASGKNASIIHYNQNSNILRRNELVLLDVGAKVHGYAADISRNWAVGVPTQRQKDVYAAALELQQIAFSKLKPGILLREYQTVMEAATQKIMKKLKCVEADKPYPHGFSHFLGLDVHDAGDYSAPLVENTVLTVEPGIYLKSEGLGVRVEDNVRITATGIEILSDKIPRELL